MKHCNAVSPLVPGRATLSSKSIDDGVVISISGLAIKLMLQLARSFLAFSQALPNGS